MSINADKTCKYMLFSNNKNVNFPSMKIGHVHHKFNKTSVTKIVTATETRN